MTAYGTIEKAKRAMREGAYDFLEKPLDLPRLRAIVESALRAREASAATEGLRESLSREGVWRQGFVGESPAIQEVFRTVAKVAPTNATVLLLGESGTGKELVAEALHAVSARSQGPFVKVNCAALPEGLLESELFGHVKGAFTGAVGDREGRFEAADRGHAVPRRGRRDPAPHAGEAPARAPGRARSSASATTGPSASTSASSRRPTPTSRRWSARDASARTSTSA